MEKFLKSIFSPSDKRKGRFESDSEEDKPGATPQLDGRRKLSISRSGRMRQANKKRHSLSLELYGEIIRTVICVHFLSWLKRPILERHGRPHALQIKLPAEGPVLLWCLLARADDRGWFGLLEEKSLLKMKESNFQTVEKPKALEYHVNNPVNQEPKAQRRSSVEPKPSEIHDTSPRNSLEVKTLEEEIESAFKIIDKVS